MVGADVFLFPKFQDKLLKQLFGALPGGKELVANVDSHSKPSRREAGAWTKTRGNQAAKVADAERQVREVFDSPDKKILYFKGARERLDVFLPPSLKYPKGKALRFVREGGKWIWERVASQPPGE